MMPAALFAYDQILNSSAIKTAVVDAIRPNGHGPTLVSRAPKRA